MKKIVYVLLLSIFLFSCSEDEIISNDTVKQDFFIETKNINDF
jgi:hypothetical protein